MSISESKEPPFPEVPLEVARQLDIICDEFESTWKLTGSPDIGRFVRRTSPDYQTPLLWELIHVDVFYRRQLGESAELPDYCRRCPELTPLVQSTQGAESTGGRSDQASGWQEATLPLRETAGLLGDHELQEIIGEGSFGCVWRAWNSRLHRVDAIKLPRDRLTGPDPLNVFLHEARAAAQLDHPNIVSVHGYGERDGQGYIVFEYVPGATLGQWIQNRAVDCRQAADICRQLADALAHAHVHHVLHRDIKSSNVLMDAANRPHLADFGLARRLDLASTIAQGGAILGTIPYMSPEQLQGKSSQVDERSDVYSLGIVLYELLTGSVPFHGERSGVIADILTRSPALPRSVNVGIPRDLETICLKAIARNNRDRYATAADFRDDLQRFLEGRPVVARRLPFPVRIWRTVRRHPALAVGYGGVALLAVLAVLLPARLQRQDTSSPETRAARRMLLNPGPNDGKWAVRIVTEPPGAEVTLCRRDPVSGERLVAETRKPDGLTPIVLRLGPGLYSVSAGLPGTRRFHEVERRVPEFNASLPIGDRNHQLWRLTEDRAIEWPAIPLPVPSVTDDMILIHGTKCHRLRNVDAPGSAEVTVAIPDFYISRTEFTVGQFLEIRPQAAENRDFTAKRMKPGEAFPQKFFDDAVHWAEAAGGRLPTEAEYDYLVQQIVIPENPLESPAEGPLRHRSWDFPQCAPDVRGLLTGLPEWVTGSPLNDSESQTRSSTAGEAENAVIRGLPADLTEQDLEHGMISVWQATRSVIPKYGTTPVAFRVVKSVNSSAPVNTAGPAQSPQGVSWTGTVPGPKGGGFEFSIP